MDNIDLIMDELGRKAKEAALTLAYAASEDKRTALLNAAAAVEKNMAQIIEANAKDMRFGEDKGLSEAMLDRLLLTEERISGICEGLRSVAGQDDPVGQVLAQWERPTGLSIQKVATPLGVIGVIYESRPNVTADAGALALKSGNAVILRGGSESFHSSQAIHTCLVEGLCSVGLPEAAIQLVPTRDREAVERLLQMTDYVDVIVPRGGKGLVGLVQQEARVPVFAHLEGIVHIYVDETADPRKALDVVLNAKTRRTGICGAAECILLHQDIVPTLGKEIIEMLISAGVEVRVSQDLLEIKGAVQASPSDWGTEFLSSIIAVRTVRDTDEAISYIQTHSSNHTDCILTESAADKALFFERVDSAILMHNASTQFADGGEFGMGAEIGIATGKLHARGPVGAAQLTSFKYLVTGDGTVRA